MGRKLALALAGIGLACGGSSTSGPSPVSTPPPAGRSVSLVAFLDENGNGTLEGFEIARIPGVEVSLGGVRGRTAALTGQVTLQVPEGTQTLEVSVATLPPFYRPPPSRPVAVPATTEVAVPITLPIGSNRPSVYMAFGDSITNGEPEVGDGQGYRALLARRLEAHFGAATVANEGVDATRSDRGAQRISESLARVRPAFTLIHYGTNDWNDARCDFIPCFTTDSLRSMVQQVNRSGGKAFLATILPTNTGYDARAPASRNDWVAQQNVLIRQVADQEGAVLVDLNAAFLRSGRPLSALFVDHVHPTSSGYEIMAETWFAAITEPSSRILETSGIFD
jgi:lysophospholipase L1-like esterase